jgi:GTP cyclohydrolase I
MSFPYFIEKQAPVSRVKSLMDYDVTFAGEVRNGRQGFSMKVVVPVTSLCPCSKKISERGAHNQRSHVTVTARTNDFVWIEEIVDIVEKQGSSELYGLLKRPDEKYVTERAYDNPKCATWRRCSTSTSASRPTWWSRRTSSRSTTTAPTP